jgi:hypothetical protein
MFQVISVTDMWTIFECSAVDVSSLFPVYSTILSVSHTTERRMLSFFFSMTLPAHSGLRPLIQFRYHFSQTVGLLG